MERTALATIDIAALRHNLSIVRSTAPHSKILAVIKANAYGHGLLQVAEALHEADAFAVSCLEEALALREASNKRIVVLQGFHSIEQLALFAENSIEPVIHQAWQIQALLSYPLLATINISIKVNTGMNRLGLNADSLQGYLSALQSCGHVGEVQLMTHMASADDSSCDSTAVQLAEFKKTTNQFDLPRSIANSATLMGWPESRVEWVRPGIMLYGVSPFLEGVGAELNLKPVMNLRTRLIAVNSCRKGDAVGYGRSWICDKDMRIGVAAIGYGDGYPRHAPSGTPVLVNGHKAVVVGRVSMDMLTIDLSDCGDVNVGAEVTLWGEGLPVEEVAAAATTIAYELLCSVYGRVNYGYINKER